MSLSRSTWYKLRLHTNWITGRERDEVKEEQRNEKEIAAESVRDPLDTSPVASSPDTCSS